MAAPHHHSLASGAFAASPGTTSSEAKRTRPGEAWRFLREVVLTYEGDSCLTWPYCKSESGYGRIGSAEGNFYVHRLACEQEHGPAPSPDLVAAHYCGRGHLGCVAKKHVRWATYAENYADAVRHGTATKLIAPRPRGERNGSAKLTEREIHQLRLCKGTVSGRAAARLFGIAESTLRAIWSGKTWSHI